MFLSSFLLLQGSGALRQPVSCTSFFVTVQSLTVTSKNPFQIGFADGIFAFKPMFSYGQRSKCADLLNSYSCLHISLGKGLQLVISALFDHLLICQAGADPKTDKTCF